METKESRARGERIRLIRKKLGLNQSDFGKMLDCEGAGKTKGTVSGYETGSINPSLDILAQIVKLGETTFEELVTGKATPLKVAEITATVQPGNAEAAKRLVDNGKRATVKNYMLRKIVAWMDETFDGQEEQALMFYEDIVRRYQSFSKFVSPELSAREQDGEKRDAAKSA
jgi:transcriptional regulator with XRE-family HTH domain